MTEFNKQLYKCPSRSLSEDRGVYWSLLLLCSSSVYFYNVWLSFPFSLVTLRLPGNANCLHIQVRDLGDGEEFQTKDHSDSPWGCPQSSWCLRFLFSPLLCFSCFFSVSCRCYFSIIFSVLFYVFMSVHCDSIHVRNIEPDFRMMVTPEEGGWGMWSWSILLAVF